MQEVPYIDSEKQVGKCIVPKPLRQNKKFNYVWQNGIHCRNNVDNTACSWNKTLTKVSLEYLLFLCSMHSNSDEINFVYTSSLFFTEAKKFTRILENITPKDILPYSWNYYTYTGSLTAPPCYESVRWIVMRCPIKISRKVSSSAIACKN